MDPVRGYGCSPTLACSAIQSQSDDQRRVKVASPNLNVQSGLRPIPASRRRGLAPTRSCAACSSRSAWADRALHGEAARLRLDARDLALATQLVLRRRSSGCATLDHVIERARPSGPSPSSTPPVLAALRLGVFQLTFLDRVPAHAAVGESVELVKADAAARRRPRQRRAAPRGARGARRWSTRCPTPRRPRPRCATRTPSGSRALWLRRARAGDGPRADGRRQRARRGGAARQHAADHRAGRWRQRLPVPARTASELPEALVLDGAVRRVSARRVARGPAHAAVARRDGRRARARARGPASACWTCAPRRAARPPTSPR